MAPTSFSRETTLPAARYDLRQCCAGELLQAAMAQRVSRTRKPAARPAAVELRTRLSGHTLNRVCVGGVGIHRPRCFRAQRAPIGWYHVRDCVSRSSIWFGPRRRRTSAASARDAASVEVVARAVAHRARGRARCGSGCEIGLVSTKRLLVDVRDPTIARLLRTIVSNADQYAFRVGGARCVVIGYGDYTAVGTADGGVGLSPAVRARCAQGAVSSSRCVGVHVFQRTTAATER